MLDELMASREYRNLRTAAEAARLNPGALTEILRTELRRRSPRIYSKDLRRRLDPVVVRAPDGELDSLLPVLRSGEALENITYLLVNVSIDQAGALADAAFGSNAALDFIQKLSADQPIC